MLRYFREATDLLVQLMRTGTKEGAVRLAAIREVLDRGLGEAPQAISVDLMMGKQLSEMSQEELLEFKAKYVAMTTLTPAVIDQVIAAEEDSDPNLLELPLDSEYPAEDLEPGPLAVFRVLDSSGWPVYPTRMFGSPERRRGACGNLRDEATGAPSRSSDANPLIHRRLAWRKKGANRRADRQKECA